MTLLTLVPRIPPMVDGVGDYADRLAQQIAQQSGIRSHFLVADPQWPATSTAATPTATPTAAQPAQALPTRSATALHHHLNQINPSAILLHYVPHGYARKACPLWLLRGLATWRQQHPQIPLITMFHELYACDWRRPWSSDFWLSPVQRTIARHLAQLSDHCFTSTEKYTRFLTRVRSPRPHSSPVTSLPVFSNIGEPQHILPLAQRPHRLIIFGQRHSKQRIYQQALPALTHTCQALGIEEIWDLGPTSGNLPSSIGPVPLRAIGPCSATILADILSTSRAGFLTYDPQRLAKSGIFAAYCAYGVLPINAAGENIRIDGLRAGEQYIVPSHLQHRPKSHLNEATELPEHLPIASLQAIVDAAQQWYRCHNLPAHASHVHQLLQLPAPYAHSR